MNKIHSLSAFDIERLRANLAAEKKLRELEKTYKRPYSEIMNKNTSSLWDNLNATFALNPMVRHRLAIVSRLIKGNTSSVLHIGFGSGSLEERVLKTKKELNWFGIDISADSVRKIQKRFPDAHFEVADITTFTAVKNSYDYIIMLEVLEHISPHKVLSMLRRLHTLLKTGGVCIVSVPMNEGLEDMVKRGSNPNEHVRMYTRPLITSELILSGFHIASSVELYAFHRKYFLKTFLVRTLLRRFRNPNNIIVVAKKL